MPIPVTHPPSAPAAQPVVAAAPSKVGAFIGGAALLGSTIAAGFLAVHRLVGFAIPGCGAGGGCDKLTKSVWGSVPGLYWPVSYLGFAYFAGMLVAWLAVRGQATAGLRWMARLGGLASLMFLGVMASEQTLCPYCLTAHIGNLIFWIVCELSNRGLVDRCPVRIAAPVAAGVFFMVSAALGMAEVRMNEKNARAQAEAVERMTATLNNPPKPPAPVPAATGPTTPPAPQPQAKAPTQPSQPATGAQDPSKGFTGRYRLGPENAPIRIVMITDYGCPDCKHFEAQAMDLLAKYPNVSLSTKHFPFCTACNSTPNTPNLHPNSCWAARAAEAAGMLYGADGFWKMHRWLFEHSGAFTDADFPDSLRGLGFEPQQFISVMQSMQTLANVQADIKEANELGLKGTPMMFVNGVLLEGWASDALALQHAVEALVAKAPQPAAPVTDKPKSGAERRAEEALAVIDLWRNDKSTPAMAWPNRKQPWVSVPESVPIKVSLWGDLLEPNCAEADKIIRAILIGRNDIRYEFRSFPFDQTCNPGLPRTVFPNGCRAAKAAEAAGQIGLAHARKKMQDWVAEHKAEVNRQTIRAAAEAMGLNGDMFEAKLSIPAPGSLGTRAAEAAGELAGTDAYWRVHVWIIDHQREFSDATLKAAAPSLGLDGDELIQRMNQPDIEQTIAWDVNIGDRIHIPEIPRVFVNGKLISRPLIQGEFVIERVIEEMQKIEEQKKAGLVK